MQRSHAMIGLASLVGAALVASPASAVTAYSPTGHLNVRSGPGFQYPVVDQMAPNVPAAVTGCISNYTWCGVATGGVTGWASAEYLVTDAGGKLTNLQVSGAQLGIPIVVPPGRRRGRRHAAGWRDGRSPTHRRRRRADPAGPGGSLLRDAAGG